MGNIQSIILSLLSDIMFSVTYPTFYSSVVKLRIKRWQYVLMMASIIMLLTPLQYILPISHLVVFISGIIINIGGIIIFGKDKLPKKIIYGLIPYAADILCSSVYLIIRSFLMPEWQPDFGVKVLSDYLEAAILLLQTILSLFIISKIIKRKKPTINDLTAIYMLIIMIVQMFIMTFIMYIYYNNVNYAVFCTVLIIYMLVSAGLTIAVLYYTVRINRKQIKQDMIEQQYQFMNTQYEQLQNSYVSYKKLRHDIKDHLNVVNGLAMQGKTEELQAYTNTLTQDWEALSSKTFCDVPAVDIIIAEKYNIASASGIKTDFVISGVKETNADNVYLSSIFANLLNNALEASSHCSHEPYISLRCAIMMKKLVITCRNSMPDHPHTKSDAQNHGYGLHIIDDFAKLLGGTFVYEHDDSMFTAIVTIPVSEGSAA